MKLKLIAKTKDNQCTYWVVAENASEAKILEYFSLRAKELYNTTVVTPFVDKKKGILHNKNGNMLPMRIEFSIKK